MTEDQRDQLAGRFEESRRYLHAVAYRMLGSRSEAEDAVQESWIRLQRAGDEGIYDLRRWLTVVVSRICLDLLRKRRAELEDYAGTWLPEPFVSEDLEQGAERDAAVADSVGLALLVVLETLTPPERLAFVLHDVFAVPFEEIATIVGRTPAAARQLASRARRRVQQSAPSPDADRGVQRRVVEAFLKASSAGDFNALIAVLDPDVELHSDGGGAGILARPPVAGAAAVARLLQERGPRFASMGRPVIVNGYIGVLVGPPGKPGAVVNFTVVRGRILRIDIIGDPAKLGGGSTA